LNPRSVVERAKPDQKSKLTQNPWFFIPTLYFAEGVPYVLINTVSVIFFKRMGIDNTQIAFWTGFLYLPWVIKMFWGPLVDLYSTKRNWILYSQLVMSVILGVVALFIHHPYFFVISLLFFSLGAFVSATHDIAVDGFYMLAQSKEQQAFFVGVRSFFYRVAMIFGSGFLVYFAGYLEVKIGDIPFSWCIIFSGTAVLILLIRIYHGFILPFPSSDEKENAQRGNFIQIFISYFRQEKIAAVLSFILLYRLGEAMLVKMDAPFMLDLRELGGLGLSTSEVGIVKGGIGVLGLIVGGILGGWLIASYGLKKCIWPMALALNLPNLIYVYLAYARPPIQYIYILFAVEQFGYGLGFSAFMVFLMSVCKGRYKTAHFAISTGLMAMGMMLPGMASGYLQKALGYPLFFILICLATIPGMIAIFFIPLNQNEKSEQSTAYS
jgi:PAT family beta-lactamase induction signal transducer AmpG